MPTNITRSYTPGRGLPRIGKLYKGAARTEQDKQKNRPGKDLDYFRVELEPNFAHLADDFTELYGEECARIDKALFFAASADTAFSYWNEQWGASGLIRRCDDDVQVSWFDPDRGRVVNDDPQPCLAHQKQCSCKLTGRLNIMLPAFTAETGSLGYFTLTTHSKRDVLHIYAILRDMESMNGGTLEGLPFTIERADESVETPEIKNGKPTGQRIKVTKSFIRLRPDEDFVRGLIQRQLNAPQPFAALPDGRYVDEDGLIYDAPPVIEASRPSYRLGAGNREQRRIGAQGSSQQTSATSSPWQSDTKALQGFLKWAADKFQYDEKDVLTALDNTRPANSDQLEKIADFAGDKRQATAAVIAYFCNYDVGAIDTWTAANSMSVETRDEAVRIVESVQTKTLPTNELPDEILF